MASSKWNTVLKRVHKDMEGLRKNGYPILRDDSDTDKDVDPLCWCTVMHGPAGTPYAGGTWRIRFTITDEFPFKNPSIGFVDKILHPNIDWASGSVCLDAISSAWTPVTNLSAVVEILLPNLLSMPNAKDPLNPAAARKMNSAPDEYAKEVVSEVKRHAYKYVDPAAATAATADACAGAGASAATDAASQK